MPAIKLQANGTKLSITQPFNLVSTQNNYDSCEFAFDSSWNGYTKTAIFYSDTTSKKSIELIDNKCVIPWENLVNDGILFIGVFGVNGTSVLPTNFVEQPLIPGSYVGADPTQPTQDIYTQLISDMNSFRDAEVERNLAEQERQTNTGIAITNANDATNAANQAIESMNNLNLTVTNQESTRQSQEETRQSNETTRQNYYNDYKVCTTYNASTPYIVANKVTYQGGTYQCILACTGVSPTYNTDNANWICIAAKGTDGTGIGDMLKNTYDIQNKATDIFTYTDNKVGDTTQLPTVDKTNVVNSIKEVSGQLEAMANEMDVLEATLSQDYKSIYSTGTGKDNALADQDFSDKVEGQSDIKVEGLTLNNLVTNGDFSNGTTGWSSPSATAVVTNGEYVITPTAASSYVRVETNYDNAIVGHKYFVYGRILPKYANTIYFQYGGVESSHITPIANTWNKITAVITPTTNTRLRFYHDCSINYIIGTDTFKVDEIMAIDLTVLGLDTLTLAQLDFMNDHYINGLQGVGSHKVVSVGKNRFDKISTVDKIISQATATYASRVIEEGFDCLKLVGNGSYLNKTLSMRFKPNTQYTFKYTAKNNGTPGGMFAIVYTDGTTSSLSLGASSFTTYTIVSTLGKSIADISLTYGNTGIAYYKLDNFQIEEGTVATTYEPYQSSELITTLPRQLHRLPNGVADTVEEVNKVAQVTYRNMEYIIQASDITTLNTSGINVDKININKQSNMKIYNSSNATLSSAQTILFLNFTPIANSDTDNASKIYCLYEASTTQFVLIVPKGLYATLAAAQTALAGTKIIYQLAQPIVYTNGVNGFSQTGNLEVYKDGTIYIEPTTLKECTNPKTYITYNLSDKSVVLGNSGELTEMQKFLVGKVLIESGTNANGRYLKFDDGTLICTNLVTLSSLVITTASGSSFVSASQTWTYPAMFTANPKVSGSIVGTSIVGFLAPVTVTTSKVDYKAVNTTSQTQNVDVSLIAIGRWK